jgi:hypothetical protein
VSTDGLGSVHRANLIACNKDVFVDYGVSLQNYPLYLRRDGALVNELSTLFNSDGVLVNAKGALINQQAVKGRWLRITVNQ